MRRLAPLAIALLALPALAAPAGAATFCTASQPTLYCATATSTTTVACTLTNTTYACTLRADRLVAGATQGPQPGDLFAITRVSIGICNGPGLCQQDLINPDVRCAWDALGHGCTVSDTTYLLNASDTLNGCLYVWVEQELQADVHPGLVGHGFPVLGAPTVASQRQHTIATYDSCA